MALSAVLHAFVVFVAGWWLWVGFQIRFRGSFPLVRDYEHRPLPNAPLVAKHYAFNAALCGLALLLLCFGTLLGLPFSFWLPSVFVVVFLSMFVRGLLISRAKSARA